MHRPILARHFANSIYHRFSHHTLPISPSIWTRALSFTRHNYHQPKWHWAAQRFHQQRYSCRSSSTAAKPDQKKYWFENHNHLFIKIASVASLAISARFVLAEYNFELTFFENLNVIYQVVQGGTPNPSLRALNNVSKFCPLHEKPVDRSNALDKLADMLSPNQTSDANINREVVIVGEPGSGTTTLAKSWCKNNPSKYSQIWCVRASYLEEDYCDLPEDQRQSGMRKAIRYVHKKLSLGKGRSLLVIDGATPDLLKKISFPTHNTDIIFTSHTKNWLGFEVLDLDNPDYRMSLAEGRQLLKQHSKNRIIQEKEANKIIRKLHYHPFLILLAGKAMRDYGQNASTYLERLNQGLAKALGTSPITIMLKEYLDYLRKPCERDPLGESSGDPLRLKAYELLCYFAYLPSKKVPVTLICSLLDLKPAELKEICQELGPYVTEKKDTSDFLSINEFTSALLPELIDDPNKKHLAKIIKHAWTHRPSILQNPQKAEIIYKYGISIAQSAREKGRLHIALSEAYCLMGSYKEAQKHATFAIELLEKKTRMATEQPHAKAAAYDAKGRALLNLKDYGAAAKAYKQALDIRLSLNHCKNIQSVLQLHLAGSYRNIGTTYARQKNYVEAEKNIRKALFIWENYKGTEESPETQDLAIATLHHELARLLYELYEKSKNDLDKLQEAQGYANNSLLTKISLFGKYHPDVASAHDLLAHILKAMGEDKRAKQEDAKAKEIREELPDWFKKQ